MGRPKGSKNKNGNGLEATEISEQEKDFNENQMKKPRFGQKTQNPVGLEPKGE